MLAAPVEQFRLVNNDQSRGRGAKPENPGREMNAPALAEVDGELALGPVSQFNAKSLHQELLAPLGSQGLALKPDGHALAVRSLFYDFSHDPRGAGFIAHVKAIIDLADQKRSVVGIAFNWHD